jgi:hypothetical protein
MRLHYLLEIVLAVGVGFGLARYRLTWPERAETFGAPSRIDSFELGIDSFLAGVGLVGGLATFVERVRGRSPVRWGTGRRVWCLVASYLLLTLLNELVGTIALRFTPGIFIQDSVSTDITRGLRGRYGEFLPQFMTWFLLALGLTSLADPTPRTPTPDGRECCGRVFAAVLVSSGLGLRALLLLGIRQQAMGGGM